MERTRGDRGDIVVGWLVRLTVVLSVLGLLAFDGIALAVGRLQTEDRAQSAARVAVSTWAETKDVQRAYEAALARVDADSPGDTIEPTAFTVAPDGAVTLTLKHTSPTLLVEKLGATRAWATTTATTTARPAG